MADMASVRYTHKAFQPSLPYFLYNKRNDLGSAVIYLPKYVFC